MPQPVRALAVRECYRRAAEARRLAAATTDPEEKRDLITVEQRWLALARSEEVEDEIKKEFGW
jgi:hypothetical protein